MRNDQIDLVGLEKPALQEQLIALGVPSKQVRMRASQLWSWLYNHGAQDFHDMSNIAKPLRDALTQQCVIARPEIVTKQVSEDGTRKYLLRLKDGNLVETVYIPETDRGTLCVSSQVGCTLNCSFCHTGTQRLVKNLSAGEIVGQMLVARDDLGEWPSPNDGTRLISNVVLMGMGEPLYNYENVAAAIRIMMSPDGIALSKRRITLSTSGVIPQMQRCGEELNVNLAISLHAVHDELRNKLVPINKKYPLSELLQACRDYPGLSNARRITFEYVMLKGVNDSLDDAKALVKMMENIPAKINLIPFNPWPGSPYECSDWSTIEAFGDYVNAAGYASPIRMPRGRDIMAACGQLKSASEKISRAERKRTEKQQQQSNPA